MYVNRKKRSVKWIHDDGHEEERFIEGLKINIAMVSHTIVILKINIFRASRNEGKWLRDVIKTC